MPCTWAGCGDQWSAAKARILTNERRGGAVHGVRWGGKEAGGAQGQGGNILWTMGAGGGAGVGQSDQLVAAKVLKVLNWLSLSTRLGCLTLGRAPPQACSPAGHSPWPCPLKQPMTVVKCPGAWRVAARRHSRQIRYFLEKRGFKAARALILLFSF